MPLISADGALSLVYNGEIYNYLALRQELRSGYSFETRGDSEVVLAAYQRWGEQLFAELEGMYAFCLIDRTSGKALLAVDHAGQKPLYYYLDPRGAYLVFASDLDTMLASGMVPFELDVPALQELALERYVRDEKTHLKNVFKLLNGTYAVLDLLAPDRGVRLVRHFVLPVNEERLASVDDAAEQLGDAIVQAHADVLGGTELSFAFLLSSGIDSSSVVALASRYLSSLTTYTLGFSSGAPGPVLGESSAASKFSDWLGARQQASVRCVEVLLASEEFPTLIDRWSLENPHLLYNRDALFLYHLFAAVRQDGLRIAVTGCGPDEIFDGYAHGRILNAAAEQGYPLELAHFQASKLAGTLDTQRLLWNGEEELSRRICEKIRKFTSLYAPDLPPLQIAQLINWHTHSQYECLKSDIASSAYGLEARKPYYVRRLVELAFQFPSAWKRREGQEKWILRRALERRRVVPRSIANRVKLAFPHPVEIRPSGRRRDRIQDVLVGKSALRASGAIDLDVIVEHFQRSDDPGDQTAEMFYSLCLGLDKERVIAESSSANAL